MAEASEVPEDAADELAAAKKELEAFSYSVSHHLRAPLRAVDGFAKILADEYAAELDDTGRHYLERIRSGTKRMGQLIDDLLGLSHLARVELWHRPIDMTAIAHQILGSFEAREPDRKVTWTVAPGLMGHGDARLVTMLYENLLGNAWKFSSKQTGAHIEAGGETRDGETVFFVRDNGAGFDMQYANMLFAPFQRLHSATEFPGTGVGLATVHRVVTRHGGRIWAESAPEKGATFFFTLGDPR